MKPAFRKFRLALWIVGFATLIWFLIQYTPWQRTWFFKPDYAKIAAPGVPIARAVFAFRNDRGLWPQYLADLAPDYLPHPPGPLEWSYETKPTGPQLWKETASPGVYVGYDFAEDNRGWKVWGPFIKSDEQNLALTQTLPPASARAPAELAERQLLELDRRIAREPMLLDHYQDKAAILHDLHRTADIRALLTTLAAARPNSYWPQMAIAVLDLETATTSTSSAPATSLPTSDFQLPSSSFPAFVAAHSSFTNYFYLYTYHRLAGDSAAALAAARRALEFPLETDKDDAYTTGYFLFRLTRFAYEQKQFDLVLSLADLWQGSKTKDMSHFAFRAAAELAEGEFDAALADVEKASIADDQGPHLWAKNLDRLAAAIVAKNRAFIYDSGPRPEYDVWTRWEK